MIQRKTFLVRGNSKLQGPEVERSSMCSRKKERPVSLGKLDRKGWRKTWFFPLRISQAQRKKENM